MVFKADLTYVVLKLSKKALGKLPVVTLAVLGFTAYLYAFPVTTPDQVSDGEKEICSTIGQCPAEKSDL